MWRIDAPGLAPSLWLGNTAAVAAEYYLQVTEADSISAAQIPAQSGVERVCQERSAVPAEMQKALDAKGFLLKSIPVNYPQGESKQTT